MISETRSDYIIQDHSTPYIIFQQTNGHALIRFNCHPKDRDACTQTDAFPIVQLNINLSAIGN